MSSFSSCKVSRALICDCKQAAYLFIIQFVLAEHSPLYFFDSRLYNYPRAQFPKTCGHQVSRAKHNVDLAIQPSILALVYPQCLLYRGHACVLTVTRYMQAHCKRYRRVGGELQRQLVITGRRTELLVEVVYQRCLQCSRSCKSAYVALRYHVPAYLVELIVRLYPPCHICTLYQRRR